MSITCAYESNFGQSFANMQPISSSMGRAPVLGGLTYSTPHIPISAPTGVHVCVDGVPFQYQLTEDDLIKVFSRYGSVTNITIMDEGGSAVVQYALANDAARAQSSLNGKVLNGVQGALRVTLFPSVPTGRTMYDRPHPMVPYKKFTCRFEIPTEVDREFCISKRIIGQKGVNMKKIVSSLPSADAAKLRLRGRGSGFLEGPLKQESNEILHLCVSCKDAETYGIVISEVTELLDEIYAQYSEWCKERGLSRSIPKAAPRQHPSDLLQAPTYGYASQEGFDMVYASQQPGPRSLYPPNWETWKNQSASYGRSPSPMSYSTQPGNSASTTPPEIVSPSGTTRGVLDVHAIERLIEERNEARRVCNFKEADRIRDLLRSSGVGLMDEPGARGKGNEVTSWRFGVKK